MEHYVQPTLRTKPNTIILHVGTNDIQNKKPEELAAEAKALCQVNNTRPELNHYTKNDSKCNYQHNLRREVIENSKTEVHNCEPNSNANKLKPFKLKGFTIALLNIRSLVKNLDQLRLYLLNQQFDVICINETRLDATVPNHEVGISGYEIVRKDRNRNGGGVAIYLRTHINYSIRKELMSNELETITIEISKPKSKPFLINCWYRPPDSMIEIFNIYEDLVKKMDNENKEVILIGDFNCDWSQIVNNNASSQTKKLAELTKTLQFEQLINEPTRVTETSKTQIDLAFTNKPEIIMNTGVDHIGISDHSLIFIQRKISIQRKAPKIIKTRQFKNYNVDEFKQELAIHLQTISVTNNPDEMWDEWKDIYVTVADRHAPPITRKVRSEHAPWITREIKNLMHRRDFLKRKSVKTGSKQIHDAFRKARNELNILIKRTKTNYFTNTLNNCENQPKQMWKTINKLTNKNTKTTII
ncbi:uncharacterized protein LOC114539748 [Dendronephthya gigantea]|uniref:uncharacterized protein LOC114539748 n=1 Tax=Dendronephthya gigantea TaxID=151771 RepID=UPI00106AB13A|nr:uncharacterized protein LOC114539748 [Dendronephthya gigantea]